MPFPSARAQRAPIAALAALVILVALSGCGTGGGSGQPSWRRSGGGTGRPPGPVSILMAPTQPAVRAYNEPAGEAPRSALSDAILREVDRVSAELGKPAPRPDARLYAAARELAEVAPADAPLVYTLIEFALQRNGIIEPSPHLVVVWGPTDQDALVASLVERLPDILRSSDFVRVGVGVAERKGGDEVTVLAFQSSFIDTTPIPRQLPSGGAVEIEASVKPPYADPGIYVTRESGDVEAVKTSKVQAGRFRSELSCGKHRGRQQIEITAHDKTGATVMANFPVWCGEDPPPSIQVDLDADETAPVTSGDEAAARLVRMVNRDRERQGLPALAIDSRLTEVALGHSREMRETGVVAHISPKTGSAADRVRAGGIKSSVVLENVARAYGVGEAQEGLMNSPGHRANILSRDATHMGIGVILGDDVAGRVELFVTQVFIRLPGRIDQAAVADRVRAMVKRKRDIDENADLTRVAQDLASGIGAGSSASDASRRAATRLGHMTLPFSRVTTLVTTVADLDAFDPSKSLSDLTVKSYGLGVAQGDHDVMGEKAIHIVLLFGHR